MITAHEARKLVWIAKNPELHKAIETLVIGAAEKGLYEAEMPHKGLSVDNAILREFSLVFGYDADLILKQIRIGW